MEVCRTDIKRIIGLLDVGAGIIKSYGRNPREQDKARLMRLMCKKLKKKMEREKHERKGDGEDGVERSTRR